MTPMAQLIDLRKKTGRSQKRVSADLNISVSTINRHEQGKTPLSGLHRLAYATYYGVKQDTIEQPPAKPAKEPARAKATKTKDKRRRPATTTVRKAA